LKTTVFIGTSLDGFIARENGEIEWLVQFANPEVNNAYNEFIRRIDAIVIGRGTFEKVLTFPTWPYDRPVFLLSNSIKQMPGALNEKVTILALKPKDVMSYLSDKEFSNIYVDGGKVIQEFLAEDLIDEIIISKAPILIGSGIPLFGYLNTDLRFKHIQTTTYSNGLVRSQYERIRN